MLLGLLAVGYVLFAQATPSRIAGLVRDAESGRPLAEATVALPDLNRTVTTDSLGRYGFTGVPPGPQHLTVRRIGYAPRTLHALVPNQGRLQIDLSLQPIPLQLPQLVVRSRVPVRGIDEGDSALFADRSVSLAQIRSDPLLAEPDALLALTGGEIASGLETPSGLHVRGGASDQTRYMLDGIPVFSPYHTAGVFTAWNPDAIERLEVSSRSSEAGLPDALSGTVSATTRIPSTAVRIQGGMSTAQARLAVDGPIGRTGAGYLVSYRTGFPALLAPRDDPSYLSGETQDVIAKVESPGLGGRVHLLLYDSRNAIGSTVHPASETDPLRNGFEWSSRSVGGQWSRQRGSTAIRLQAWSAISEAEATWISETPLNLASEREDYGLLAAVERGVGNARTEAGLRLERSRTDYRVEPLRGADPVFETRSNTPLASLFLQHEGALGATGAVSLGGSVTSAVHGLHVGLQSRFRWRVATPLVVSAGYGRTHQFAQSLRNSESVVGIIFPADLYVGAGTANVPVARSQQGVIGAEYRPATGVRVAAQIHVTTSAGLLLVAPMTGEPFATAGYTTGFGTAPGFSLEAGLSRSRYGLIARYGWQRVRLEHADSSYTPIYGTGHTGELGAILFPSTTSSIRVGLVGAAGRRATAVSGAFEWEACNLLDRGCEFGGSPQATGALGATRLPMYLRLDLSVRKHWHLRLANRDMSLALFGTITNLLGRTNVLTMASDPTTGRRTAIEMRPLAPLVAGIDWQF
jgi:hypothetical protein